MNAEFISSQRKLKILCVYLNTGNFRTWLTEISEIRFVNIDDKFKRMAKNENQDDPNKNCSCGKIPENKNKHMFIFVSESLYHDQ